MNVVAGGSAIVIYAKNASSGNFVILYVSIMYLDIGAPRTTLYEGLIQEHCYYLQR